MDESQLVSFFVGAMAVLSGVGFLTESYVPESRKIRPWKSFRSAGDEVSLRALGVLGVSFGLVQSFATLVSIAPLWYLICSGVLLIAASLTGRVNRGRTSRFPQGSRLSSRAVALVPQVATAMAIILLLKWPWALYGAGTMWLSPEPLKVLYAVCWFAGLLLGIFIVVRLLAHESRQFFRRKSKGTHSDFESADN